MDSRVRVHIADCVRRRREPLLDNEHYPHQSILSILSPIRGGDYRGIYDIGFKRGFMGYIGLLLNAPYKRIG
jgi:hypothetical protein